MWQACRTKWGMGVIRTSGFFWLVTFLLGIECGQPEHEEFHIGHPSQLAPDALIFALKDSADALSAVPRNSLLWPCCGLRRRQEPC